MNVTESTSLNIPLFGGKIKGASKLNLKKFVSSLDTNIRFALVNILLETVGLHVVSDEIKISSEEKLIAYKQWLAEKETYQNTLTTTVVKVLNDKFKKADAI
jgi:predicted AlkP superfamily phosphohydrolase/phosphomutase